MRDYKGELLAFADTAKSTVRPEFFHFEYGPDHDKVFLCICSFQGRTSSHQGRTKVEAEQSASKEILSLLGYGASGRLSMCVLPCPDRQHFIVCKETDAMKKTLHNDPQFEVFSLYGDAIFRYEVARYLFDEYPFFQEGVLTRIISEVLRLERRADAAKSLRLNIYSKGDATERLMAQAFSALIGKYAFVSDNENLKRFLKICYKTQIDLSVVAILQAKILSQDLIPAHSIETKSHNYKGELLEYAQGKHLPQPRYDRIKRQGPDHAPTFTVKCSFRGRETEGSGSSLKSAEQEAAQNMLSEIKRSDAQTTRSVSISSSLDLISPSFKIFEAFELLLLGRSLGCPGFTATKNLEHAFTHPSKNQQMNYQRLEFIGDALIRKILLSEIITRYPDIQDKAELSSKMDCLVSAEMQAKVATNLGLERFIFSDAFITPSLLSDVLEALIAALYLDAEQGNVQALEKCIVQWFDPEIKTLFNQASAFSTEKPSASQISLSANPQSFLNKSAETSTQSADKSSDEDEKSRDKKEQGKKKKRKEVLYTLGSFGSRSFS